MNTFLIRNFFKELDSTEVLRIELINGNKIYCLPSDSMCVSAECMVIEKPIKDKRQQIIIDANSIAVVCTMSRQTYELKLNNGELYV